MKNFIYAFWLLIASISMIACRKVEKDPLSYYPKVKTVSAEILDDGSVQVTGEIESEGTEPIEYAGFCMDTIPEPAMAKNQMITSVNGSGFSAIYQGFDITKKYYFRAWAANEYGYAIGNTLSLDSITGVPVVAPCSPVLNSMHYGGLTQTQYFYDVSLPVENFDTWEVTGQTGSGFYYFEFGASPVTRKYTTTTSDTPGPGEVYIHFSSGFTSGVISNGASLYVNQVSPGNWTMTLCQAPWVYNGSTTFNMTTSFVCPLP